MTAKRPGERASFYVWTAVLLAAAVAVVVLGWHARGGTPDPTDAPGGHRGGVVRAPPGGRSLGAREESRVAGRQASYDFA